MLLKLGFSKFRKFFVKSQGIDEVKLPAYNHTDKKFHCRWRSGCCVVYAVEIRLSKITIFFVRGKKKQINQVACSYIILIKM
jgi:hypothetical protein